MSIMEIFKKQTALPEHFRTMSEEELCDYVTEIKAELGTKLYMPGHHYQKDEVIQFCDDRGDSLQLAQAAERRKEAKWIVFCGVHFMAETADILTEDHQHVILPDLRAGCSMADMADIHQTERAWEKLNDYFGDTILPITYVNSTAEIKAFCGKRGGATVTSSNAAKMVKWALDKKERLLFLPDQHLGRNTAYDLGIALEEMAVWDPISETLLTEGPINQIRIILWKGHCSVHEKFTMDNIETIRTEEPDRRIIVHPECTWEVVQAADYKGSTKAIIDAIDNAKPESKWAIGTEMNLVNRLIKEYPDRSIISLNPNMCPCLTMNRIDLPHLAWSLGEIRKQHIHHKIKVKDETAYMAKKALDRMLVRA
ncbi:quinolinate synthase NadA [Salsuginibacillus kocurii]|uniref:quinolinate synthase NadA n=1 Tax=Salsuginibacillus kocurii TaxID=427078 RepID=UPI0003762124|nr:quinolinate synthase NadA [Salsuginibacillus kocurii]